MYEVVVLIERPLAESDARMLADLYVKAPEPTRLHVLLPTDDAPSQVESMLSSLSDSSGIPTPMTPPVSSDDLHDGAEAERAHRVDVHESVTGLNRTVEHLRALGVDADGEIVTDEPMVALESIVAERGSDEVVIMTRTHVVAQFLHIDWASAARRHLDVPVLHLLEHSED